MTQSTTLTPPVKWIREVVIEYTHSDLKTWESRGRSDSALRGKRVMCLIARERLRMSTPEIARLCFWQSPNSATEAIEHARNSDELRALADALYAKAVEIHG